MQQQLLFEINFKKGTKAERKNLRSGKLMGILRDAVQKNIDYQSYEHFLEVAPLNKKIVYDTHNLNLWYGNVQALKDINLAISEKEVTAIIGPSGCGKSTFLKTLNRMVELIPKVRTSGTITYRDKDILDK